MSHDTLPKKPLLSLSKGFFSSKSSIDELTSLLNGKNVFLVGMMGSGKSTIGKVLAKFLSYGFYDTDEVVEEAIKMPISEYFAQGKAAKFRTIEHEILDSFSLTKKIVIATGGGIVERDDNWSLMRRGISVFLEMSPEDIYNRLKIDPTQIQKRPLLADPDPLAKLQELNERRKNLYSQADIRVEIKPGITPHQISEEAAYSMLNLLKNSQKLELPT